MSFTFDTPYKVKSVRVFHFLWNWEFYIDFEGTRVIQGLSEHEAHTIAGALNGAYNIGKTQGILEGKTNEL